MTWSPLMNMAVYAAIGCVIFRVSMLFTERDDDRIQESLSAAFCLLFWPLLVFGLVVMTIGWLMTWRPKR